MSKFFALLTHFSNVNCAGSHFFCFCYVAPGPNPRERQGRRISRFCVPERQNERRARLSDDQLPFVELQDLSPKRLE